MRCFHFTSYYVLCEYLFLFIFGYREFIFFLCSYVSGWVVNYGRRKLFPREMSHSLCYRVTGGVWAWRVFFLFQVHLSSCLQSWSSYRSFLLLYLHHCWCRFPSLFCGWGWRLLTHQRYHNFLCANFLLMIHYLVYELVRHLIIVLNI